MDVLQPISGIADLLSMTTKVTLVFVGVLLVVAYTTFAEQEGTFTNHEGRVQRFWPALQAPGAARPAWLILSAVVAQRTEAETPRKAEAVFAALAGAGGAFAGISYDDIGTRGAVVNETLSLSGD